MRYDLILTVTSKNTQTGVETKVSKYWYDHFSKSHIRKKLP